MPSKPPVIREHWIPTPDSGPYIAVEGPDGNLWFCESRAAKIGCFDPNTGSFREFALPSHDSMPIGIAAGSDGNLWFTEKEGNRVGRITLDGAIAEFAVPTVRAAPDGIVLGPDGNVWFSEGEADRIARVTADGRISELGASMTAGSRPLSLVVRDGALWFSQAGGGRIARMTVDRHHRVSHSHGRQSAARDDAPSRRQHLVRGDGRERAWPHRARWLDRRVCHSDAECFGARRCRHRGWKSLVH